MTAVRSLFHQPNNFLAAESQGLQPWDSAAAKLLVEEAGGKVVTYRGQEHHPYKNSLVAGNSIIVDKLVASMSGEISKDSH